jgi:hypothetical protein
MPVDPTIHSRALATSVVGVLFLSSCTKFSGPWEAATCTVGTQGETWPAIVGSDSIIVFDSPLPSDGSNVAESTGAVLSAHTSTPIETACRPLGSNDSISSSTNRGYWTGGQGTVQFTYENYEFDSIDGVVTILNGALTVATTDVSMTRFGPTSRVEPLEDLTVQFSFVNERYACCWE